MKQFCLIDDVTYEIFRLLEKGIELSKIQERDFDIDTLKLMEGLPLDFYISKATAFLSKMENDWRPEVIGQFSSEQIKREFFRSPQIVFEVTEKCNLACKYCAYGSFYTGFDKRVNKSLNTEYAKNLIKYIFSNKDMVSQQHITISFYGGEPLLNIGFIEEIVNFCKKHTTKNQVLKFTMTTNGTLLNKYIKFLVKHNFEVLISIDGNRKNNSYRIYKNGRESFFDIIKNIELIAKEHSSFFERNVNFIAVLHNKNSIRAVNDFIFGTYGKYPFISEIAPDGVLPNKKNDFLEMFKNKHEDLLQTKDYYYQLTKKNIEKTPDFDSSVSFINNLTNLKISDFSQINNLKTSQDRIIPTGTCLPFQRKIFVTANGKILPCEGIDHLHSLGRVDCDNVSIDFKAIAKSHNLFLNKIARQCEKCYRITSCANCIYTMDFSNNSPICDENADKREFTKYLSEEISFLESNKQVIKKVLYETELS